MLHGTPAGGAGLLGCMEVGASVEALCYDDHRRTNLNNILLERAAESMIPGTTMVFKSEALQARSTQLSLTKVASAPDETKEKKK